MFPSDRNNVSSGDNGAGAPLSIVTIALDRDVQNLLRLWLPGVNLREMAEYPNDQPSFDWLAGLTPDVCLIDFDRNPSKAFMTAEQIHEDLPETASFAVSSDSQPDIIIQAMRGGCREYLFKPLARDQLIQAINRAGVRRRERKERTTSEVLTFIGAKGGVGVTTIITQLGALLSAGSKRTLLMDLHPTMGDASLYLGFTNSRYHSFELMENTERLDAEFLQGLVLQHSSGLHVLPSPSDFEATRHLSAASISNVMAFLRLSYDYILVDAPAGLNDQTAKLVGQSDWIYIMTIAEVSALRNTARIGDFLTQEEVPPEKIRIILNRYEKRSPIPEAQIEKVIRRKIFWAVPNQYQQAVKTISGVDGPANLSRSELLRSIKGWADSIGAAKAPEPEAKPARKGGLLGLFGGSN